MIRVLFICTGNICRSPTAEAVFRHHVAAAGLQGKVEVASAGTHDYHVGACPDPRTIAAAAQRGYDLSALRARQLRRTDYARFDHLLAMDQGHLALLLRASPVECRDRIRLFLDHAPQQPRREVPDPYYGSAEEFELVLDLVEAASRGLLAHLRPQLKAAER
jgi:protein-tyrosine phosphatase